MKVTFLKTRLEQILEQLTSLRLDVREFVFEAPAHIDEIRQVEIELGFEIPQTFRHYLSNVSRHIEFIWFTPNDFKFGSPFDEIFCGDLHWSLDFTRKLNQGWNESLLSLFPDRSNP